MVQLQLNKLLIYDLEHKRECPRAPTATMDIIEVLAKILFSVFFIANSDEAFSQAEVLQHFASKGTISIVTSKTRYSVARASAKAFTIFPLFSYTLNCFHSITAKMIEVNRGMLFISSFMDQKRYQTFCLRSTSLSCTHCCLCLFILYCCFKSCSYWIFVKLMTDSKSRTAILEIYFRHISLYRRTIYNSSNISET